MRPVNWIVLILFSFLFKPNYLYRWTLDIGLSFLCEKMSRSYNLGSSSSPMHCFIFENMFSSMHSPIHPSNALLKLADAAFGTMWHEHQRQRNVSQEKGRGKKEAGKLWHAVFLSQEQMSTISFILWFQCNWYGIGFDRVDWYQFVVQPKHLQSSVKKKTKSEHKNSR